MGNHNEFVLSILKGLDIFADLSYHSLQELSCLFEERIFNQGEIIFEEGSIGTSMMVITSGEVRISQTPDPNTEETLQILKEGDVFGEMALIDDLPRSATTIAHSNVIIFEISRSNFLAYVRKDCESGMLILLKLAKILSARLRETDNKLKAFVNLSQWI
ncbi:MAG: cyclic nucleotide-binding domain-containing protein [bacterium]|nr:cyclic nucleotide-binding domain-containing protein [bacterium]